MTHHRPDYQVYYKTGRTIPGHLAATASEIPVYSNLLMTGWAHSDIKMFYRTELDRSDFIYCHHYHCVVWIVENEGFPPFLLSITPTA